MGKRQQRELQRLEEALMAVEYTEDEADQLEHTWRQASGVDYDMYNTDAADVDLEDYSEDVYQESERHGLSGFLTMLAMVALSACILLLLKVLGVL